MNTLLAVFQLVARDVTLKNIHFVYFTHQQCAVNTATMHSQMRSACRQAACMDVYRRPRHADVCRWSFEKEAEDDVEFAKNTGIYAITVDYFDIETICVHDVLKYLYLDIVTPLLSNTTHTVEQARDQLITTVRNTLSCKNHTVQVFVPRTSTAQQSTQDSHKQKWDEWQKEVLTIPSFFDHPHPANFTRSWHIFDEDVVL
jgi:hypothetical protein